MNAKIRIRLSLEIEGDNTEVVKVAALQWARITEQLEAMLAENIQTKFPGLKISIISGRAGEET